MEYKCIKVRSAQAAYTDPTDQHSRPIRGFEVQFVPTVSQHDQSAGVLSMTLRICNDCPYEEGKTYEL